MATPKPHMIRVHDDTWDAALARARSERRTLAAVVNEFLETYGQTPTERRNRQPLTEPADA